MNKEESNLTRFDKVKTIFYLGISCNSTTIVGCVAVWVALSKLGYGDNVLPTALLVFSFVPIFMADAVNNYTLARIKLEWQKGWDDVQITPISREKVAKLYNTYRAMSILPAYLLAATFVATFTSNPSVVKSLKLAFLTLFVLNFTRAMQFIQNAIAPRLPSFGGKSFLTRMIIVSICFSLWFLWLWQAPPSLTPKSHIALSGFFYFILSGIMHPLPTRFSLLSRGKPSSPESFLTVELISQQQLSSLSKENIAENKQFEIITNENFELLKYFKMPLIELPLFQMWGITLINSEKNTLAILFENEIKPGVFCTFVSTTNNSYIITTNFHAEGAKFPSTIEYEEIDTNQRVSEVLKYHLNRANNKSIDISKTAWVHLETIFKQIIEFLKAGPISYKKITKLESDKTTN